MMGMDKQLCMADPLGVNVSIHYDGETYSRYFPIAVWGSRDSASRAARDWGEMKERSLRIGDCCGEYYKKFIWLP